MTSYQTDPWVATRPNSSAVRGDVDVVEASPTAPGRWWATTGPRGLSCTTNSPRCRTMPLPGPLDRSTRSS